MLQKKTNVCGIISLTLGIIGIIATCTGFGHIIAIPGLILGLIGMCLPGFKKGIAIAGFVVNIAAIACTVCLVVILEMFSDAMDEVMSGM